MRAILAAWLLCPALLSADTVLLKNGRQLKGNIRYQDSEVIHLESGGRTEIIRKREIRRMKFEAPVQSPPDRQAEQKRQDEEKSREREARAREAREREVRRQQAQERQTRERLRMEREKRDREARLKKENERIATEKREREAEEARRLEAERAAAEKAAEEKAAMERDAAEKAEADKLAAEKAESEKAESEKAAAEKAASDKADRERQMRDREAAEQAAEQKAADEREAAARERARLALEEQKKREEHQRASEQNPQSQRYFLFSLFTARGTARGGAAQTALYNMESYSRFSGGLGVRERHKPSSFSSSSSSESDGSSSESSLRRSIDGTDGSALGSSHALSPFSAGSHAGGRMEAAFITGLWRFALSAEQLRSRDYITLDIGAGVSGPAGASLASLSMGTATLAEKRTSYALTAQYSFFQRELLDLFVVGGLQSRSHNVRGQSMSLGAASGQGGVSLLAEEKASTKLRGVRFGAGLQIAGSSLGFYSRLEAYSLSGTLSASAFGAGRFLAFTPASVGAALPMINQRGREGGIAWTTGFFVRFFTRYYFNLEYTLDSSDFRVLETKTFGLDFSSDPQAILAGVLFPQWYTSNPLLARPPYRAKYRTISAGLSVRIDWERKN